ncbi:MAG: CdaR family protein [Chloroflexia bacterium]
MKAAKVSRGSNPAEGKVTTTGEPTVEAPVSPDGSSNGSATLEVEGLQRDMGAGQDWRAQAAMLSGPLTASDLTTGSLRKPARAWLPVIPGLSLDDRLGRLLLSIVLALLLWFYVLNLENPEQTTNFNGLTVEMRGAGPDLKVINSLPTVDSIVQAPQNVMGTLNQADIQPYVDLTGLSEGVHEIPVRVEIKGGRMGAAQVTLSPRTVQVQLEAQTSTQQVVTAKTNGTPAFGYALEPAEVKPGQVRVIGSKGAVARVAEVVVPVDVDEKAGTQRGLRTPVALDNEGNEIAGLSFEPEEVEVTVPIKLLFTYKVVTVRPQVIGQPAPGYSVLAITFNPTLVTACCRPDVLETLDSLDTTPVTITGSTTTVTATTELILPEGVELYPGQKKSVDVTVTFERQVTTLQVSVAPSVEGLSDGFSAVVSPSGLDLVLSGTFSQLQSLKPADVRVFVSVQGRGPGTYELQPQIILPEGMSLDKATPDRITVTITAPTTVPPTPTIPPTTQPTAQPSAPPTQQATVLPPTQTVQVVVATPTLRPSPAPPTAPPTAPPSPTQTTPISQPSPSSAVTPTSLQPDTLSTPGTP